MSSEKYLAKIWGNAHGYYGTLGGWIYKEDGPVYQRKTHKRAYVGSPRPVCHGWEKLYKAHRAKILAWYRDKKNEQEKTQSS